MISILGDLPTQSQPILDTEEWESIEPQMETDSHRQQLDLLIACLTWYWRERKDVYVTGNLTIFFSPDEKITEKMSGPDFFVVLNVDPRPRSSWMVWKENYRYPNLIIELLSDSTAKGDRETKRALYQNQFQTPEYFWFHPITEEFAGLRLDSQGAYQEIERTKEGWYWSEQLELYLGIHEGQLRYYTPTGEMIPTPYEYAAQASQARDLAEAKAEQAQQQAEQAEQEAERLRQCLRNLGIDP
jgi:Uma2 family endonuclease